MNVLGISGHMNVFVISDVSAPLGHWNVVCQLAETAYAFHHALLTVS